MTKDLNKTEIDSQVVKEEEVRNGFAKRLVKLMGEKNLTIREVAHSAKISSSTLGNWRSGHLPTDFAAIRRLANILNCSLSFLLTGEEDLSSKEMSFEMKNLEGTWRVTIRKVEDKI